MDPGRSPDPRFFRQEMGPELWKRTFDDFYEEEMHDSCAFENGFFYLPWASQALILEFLLPDYFALISLNSRWFYKVHETLNTHLN